MINEFLTSTYLPCVCPQTTFGCKSLAANVAMKRPVLEPLNLRLVVPGVKHEYNVLFSSIFLVIIDAGIPEMLLEVGQLDERAAALRNVTFVRAFS